MLGRRKSRSSPEAIDITDRVRRRKLGGGSFGGGEPANSGNRFSRPQPAQSAPSRPGAKSAEVLSFDHTPAYRVQAAACVGRETLYLALAVLADRLETQGPVAGSRQEMWQRIGDLIGEVLDDLQLRLDVPEQSELIERLLDELIGFGPLGVLLADDSVSDILVNAPDAVYVKRRGRVQATDVAFRGPAHLAVVVERIAAAAAAGRRFDGRRPLLGLRISDRVRADIVAPPFAADRPQVTLRKGVRLPIALERMVTQGSLSADMAEVLNVAVRCRVNILIAGAAGSGKTALLDAISELIDPRERIVTIEEAAELCLRQPQVVRLVGRPPSGARAGECGQQQLVKTALRMRPDRVVIGELRGGEASDLLVAISGGLDGMLGTLRASTARTALGRLDRLVSAAEPEAPMHRSRSQVAEAVDLVVLLERCGDGLSRVIRIAETAGLTDDVSATRALFTFDQTGKDENGRVLGNFEASGLSPRFMERVKDRALERRLRQALGLGPGPAARKRG